MFKKTLLTLGIVSSIFANNDMDIYINDSNDRILNKSINNLTLINIDRDYQKKIMTNKIIIDSAKIMLENFGKEYYKNDSISKAELSQLLKQNLVKNICLSNIGLLRDGFKIENEISDTSNVVDTTIYVKLKDCQTY